MSGAPCEDRRGPFISVPSEAKNLRQLLSIGPEPLVLNSFGDLLSEHIIEFARHQPEGEVKPTRHSTTGDEVAIVDDALWHHVNAEFGEFIECRMVRARATPRDDTGVCPQHRARAHARDNART